MKRVSYVWEDLDWYGDERFVRHNIPLSLMARDEVSALGNEEQLNYRHNFPNEPATEVPYGLSTLM